MWWRLLISGVVTVLLGSVGSYLAKVPPATFVLMVGLPLVVVLSATWAVNWVRTQVSGLRLKVSELTLNVMTIGAIGHVLALRSEVREVLRERETIIDALPDGGDLTILHQIITRARPGGPIGRFPVIYGTDRLHLTFAELNYQVVTPETGEYVNHERLLIDNRLVKFIIHNRLHKEITYEGEPVEFSFSTSANTIDPERDWAGIHAGGKTELVRIKIWFPSDKWRITWVEAYKGLPPSGNEICTPKPQVGEGTKDGVSRTYIHWERGNLTENEGYYVMWEASEGV